MQAPVCRDCFTGTLRGDVTPRGKEETIHGLPTYVTGPDPGVEPIGTVVILTDAFGWTLRNTRALADAYAQRVPCTVYVPDFMDGSHALPSTFLTRLDPPPPPATASLATRFLHHLHVKLTFLSALPTLLTFLYHTRFASAHPRVLAFLRALRNPTSSTAPAPKLAVAGFCWGGLHAVRLTHNVAANKLTSGEDGAEHPLIDCAFTAHPSLLSLPGDIDKVYFPLSVANGDDDKYMGKEKMVSLVKTLEGKCAGEGTAEGEREEGRYEAVVYPGAKHGFAVRGDPGDPLQRESEEGSEEQAVRWFRRFFG